MAYDAQIHILDGQNDVILDFITAKKIIDDTHKKSLEDTLETYEFITLADKRFSQNLEKRNRIIIPDEDETLREFVIFEVAKYRDTEGYKAQVFSHASYLELKKARILYPTRREGLTASQHAGWALNDTGWTVGIVEAEGTRTFTIEKHTNPYEFLKRIANEFEVELRFRIEHDGQRITGRYVDLLERIGEWRGREIEFGEDLDGIRRIEKQDIVTALLGLGPEREDGSRIEVLVEDEEALQRWGRIDEHGNLHHLIEPYEIQSERQEMTEEEARQYTRTALNKRINTQVTYETTIVDLENVPGMENKKIRFGDTIKIKDTKFNPPLYLEARVFELTRSIKSKAKKEIKLGDYIEYTEEEVRETWRQYVDEIRKRIERLVLVSIISSAGNVFKNGEGTTELTAKTFLGGAEVDEDGTKYEYRWHKFDKNGDYDAGFYEEGKTITVNASDIDEKASFRVEIILDNVVLTVHEITLTNVFDGEDGEPGPPGPKGEDGKTFYTWIKYADTPTSGMSDSPEGKEYIGIAYNKETPTPSTNYADYTWSKFKGEQGIPGPPGEDGQPTYTWVKYADDENGNGMSDSPDGKLYIGLAFNKTTPEESNNPADYTWSLMPQNIEIGGRNLLRNSGGEREHSGGVVQYPFTEEDLKDVNVGDTITYSFWARLKNDDTYGDSIDAYFRTSSAIIPSTNMPTQKVTKEWKLFKYTFVLDEQAKYETVTFRVRCNQYVGNNTQHIDILVRNVKIEKGNKATDWERAPEDVQAEIDEAKQEAEEAKQEAQNAMSTADGKNTVFRQSSTPPTTNRKIGDLWFKTDEGNKMLVWTGEWTETKLDYQALSVGQLSAISADLGNVTAGHIEGVTMNLAGGKVIIEEDGTAIFKGKIEGSEIVGSTFKTEGQVNTITIDSEGRFKTENDFTNTKTEIYDEGIMITTSAMDRGTQVQKNLIHFFGMQGGGVTHAQIRYIPEDDDFLIENAMNDIIIDSWFDDVIIRGDKIHLDANNISIPHLGNALWTGERYPTDAQSQTIYPSKPLSDCMTGWILRWQTHTPGTGTSESNFQYTIVPKVHAEFKSGYGMRVPLANATDGIVNKYIYIYNDRIAGHAANGQAPANVRALTGVFEF